MAASDLFYRYYDLLFEEKDYKDEVRLVLDLYRKTNHSLPLRVLEIGCGTGNHTVEFSKETEEVVAVDIDQRMVRLTRDKLEESGLENVTVYDTPIEELAEEGFDVAVALFNVITYLPDTATLNTLMKAVAERLMPGGIFIFDCWNGIASIIDPPASKSSALECDGLRIDTVVSASTDLIGQLSDIRYEITVSDGDREIERGQVTLGQTLWTPMQILDAIRCAGLESVSTAPFPYEERALCENDRKMIFCCRKPLVA